MPKYRIAWLSGDGVGNDVMEAAKIVLDALKLDAEYIHGDIGWEFWKNEGNPLPDRTIKMMKETDCALFGAITSKPKQEAARELKPELQDKGFEYFSPIVRLRQEFNLHTNLRPCKAYPGNPLNYKEGIDLVIFRENTEGMYGGVEFFPIPEEVFNVLDKNHPKMKKFEAYGKENLALSTRIMSRQKCENIVTQAFEFAKKYDLPLVVVINPLDGWELSPEKMKRAFIDEGKLVNSGEFDGMRTWMLLRKSLNGWKKKDLEKEQ